MARAATAMGTTMREASDKEGDGDDDKGVGQGTVTVTKRAMATAKRAMGQR
jgi:hypothetical protein